MRTPEGRVDVASLHFSHGSVARRRATWCSTSIRAAWRRRWCGFPGAPHSIGHHPSNMFDKILHIIGWFER